MNNMRYECNLKRSDGGPQHGGGHLPERQGHHSPALPTLLSALPGKSIVKDLVMEKSWLESPVVFCLWMNPMLRFIPCWNEYHGGKPGKRDLKLHANRR